MFQLIDLPYAPEALEPVISASTLEFHHGKHLQGYVDNLNKMIAGTEFEGKPLEEIIAMSSGVAEFKAIFNNAGQILNHELYFTQFRSFIADAPQDDKTCHSERSEESKLLMQIERQWSTLDAFKAEFETKGTTLFGSGWVWLQANEAGELSIAQYAGADNPVAHVIPGSTGNLRPLLTFDVWEHAYYLDYQNRRAAHLAALWQIVDWEVIEERYNR